MEPTLFRVADEDEYRYMCMRVKSGTEEKTYASLQKQWSKLFPETPFLGGHQQDVWGSYFQSVDRSEKFNKIIASIAVLLACLGLYGLVTLNVSGRFKEFSIRKTLGAGIKNIASVIVRQYVVLTAIALTVGAPISYLFTQAYLNMIFAYPMPMSYSGVAIAVLILVVVLMAVILSQIKKVLKINPVEGLKAD
jgi:ABC-type antimicrobial peptide transport system permease subunit